MKKPADVLKSTVLAFFVRFIVIFTVYKLYDMICFDYFLLMKFHFFQFYFPEIESVARGRRYGYNIKSQLIKLLIIFPAVSALAAWMSSGLRKIWFKSSCVYNGKAFKHPCIRINSKEKRITCRTDKIVFIHITICDNLK